MSISQRDIELARRNGLVFKVCKRPRLRGPWETAEVVPDLVAAWTRAQAQAQELGVIEVGVFVRGLLYWTSKRPQVFHSASLLDDAALAQRRGIVFTVHKKERGPNARAPGVWVTRGETPDLAAGLALAKDLAREPDAREAGVMVRGIIYWTSKFPEGQFTSRALETNLDTLSPDVADAFRSASPVARWKAAAAACERSVRHAGIGGEDVASALHVLGTGEVPGAGLGERLRDLADEFEGRSCVLRQAANAEQRDESERFFSKAAAANALADMVAPDRDRLDEAICWSATSMENPDELLRVVLEALK
jgi:hypothetical protein